MLRLSDLKMSVVPLKSSEFEETNPVFVRVWVHLCVCVVVDVAGGDHMTYWIGLYSHFLLNQQRQIHNLETDSDWKHKLMKDSIYVAGGGGSFQSYK